MDSKIKIAVLGGGGKTGKFVVDYLLSKGYQLKVLLRRIPENDDADSFSLNLQNSNLEIVLGDAVRSEDIRSLVADCQAVISTIGQRPGEPMVASAVTRNMLEVWEEFSLQRYISIAGINVDTPFDKKGESTRQATEWMKAKFPIIQQDRALAYTLLSQSEINWTLVRVPMIEFTPGTFVVEADLEDCRGVKISAMDIAIFLEGQLHDQTYMRKAPFLYQLD